MTNTIQSAAQIFSKALQNQQHGYLAELVITDLHRQAAIRQGALQDYLQNFEMSADEKEHITTMLDVSRFRAQPIDKMNSFPAIARRRELTRILLNELLNEVDLPAIVQLDSYHYDSESYVLDFDGLRYIVRNAGEVVHGWHFCPNWPKRQRDIQLNINIASHEQLLTDPGFSGYVLFYYQMSDKQPSHAHLFSFGKEDIEHSTPHRGKNRKISTERDYYAVPIPFQSMQANMPL